MTEPAGSWLDPNVQFNISNDPAQFELPSEQPSISNAELLGRIDYFIERQELMVKQLEWLCFHVSNILQMAQSNPMVKMMMNKAAKNG